MKGTIWLVEVYNTKTYELFMSTNVYKRFDPRVMESDERIGINVGYRRCPLSGSRNLPLLSTGIFRKIYLYIITAFLKILKIRFPLLLFYLSLYDIKECVICNGIDIRKYLKKLSKLFCNWLGFFHFFYVSIT